MKPSQIAASTTSLAGYNLQDATETIRRLGYKSVGLLAQDNSRNALGSLAGFAWHCLEANGMNAVRDAVGPFEGITIHAPYEDLPLVSCSPEVRSLSQIIIQKSTESAPYLHGSVVTFHLEPPRFFDAESVWDAMLAAGREVARYAHIFRIKVGVESSPGLAPDTFVRLIRELDAPSLGATLDVGATARAALAGQPAGPEAIALANDVIVRSIRELGQRLYHVHLHDLRPDDWTDHHELGTGVLDLGRIIRTLDDAGYTGLCEVELEEDNREEALWNSRLVLEQLVTD
ncbi:MAG: sugar phosphate isomerase/epimerase [Chloroflexi bacterium]|nr:sugar phosphate isomerase/epimerase [Chloroflexota bacterium]